MRAYVHRDIRKKVYSVTVRGRVVEKPTHVHVVNASFRVRPAGRARVLRERKKNVHAFIVGDITDMTSVPVEAIRVKYDPYVSDRFFDPDTGSVVESAREVWLLPDGVWAMI